MRKDSFFAYTINCTKFLQQNLQILKLFCSHRQSLPWIISIPGMGSKGGNIFLNNWFEESGFKIVNEHKSFCLSVKITTKRIDGCVTMGGFGPFYLWI